MPKSMPSDSREARSGSAEKPSRAPAGTPELARWKALWASAVEASGNVLYVLDLANRTISFEGKVEGILGERADGLNGPMDDFLTAVHPEDRVGFDVELERALRVGDHFHRRFRFRRKDESTVTLDDTGAFSRDATGKATTLVGFLRDVTAEEAAARVLVDRERRFRQIFDASLDGIAINGHPEGTYLRVNEEFARVTGWPQNDLLGRTPSELGIWVDQDVFRDVLATLRRTGAIRDLEARFRRKDGSLRWMLFSAVLTEIDDRPSVLSFTRDVTEYRNARDAALEASRLKSAFLANISHEIRTPLNVITGYASMIAEEANRNGQAPHLIGPLQASSQRLLRTMTAVLDLSRLETGDFTATPVELPLRPLIDRIARDFAPTAEGKMLSFRCDVEDELCAVADEYCLSQAISHLVDNAIKFTDRGAVTVRARRVADRIAIEVEDTGVGIDEAYARRLFEPFTQEQSGYTRRFEGTGLGLALAKRYLEKTNGKLLVETEKGRGSTFRALIDARPPHREVVSDRKSRRPRILVVEDDVDTQSYLRILFRSRYDVSTAMTGEEARGVLRELPVDLVLLDLALPGGEDGMELARSLRSDPRWRHVPILAVTARADPQTRNAALKAGCSGFLEKPVDRDELLAWISELLTAARSEEGQADSPRFDH